MTAQNSSSLAPQCQLLPLLLIAGASAPCEVHSKCTPTTGSFLVSLLLRTLVVRYKPGRYCVLAHGHVQNTPASTGAGRGIDRDSRRSPPHHAGALPCTQQTPTTEIDTARVIDLSRLCDFLIFYVPPITPLLSPPQPNISTGLLHDLVTLMAPASTAFRMIRKRRFSFRSI
jgi:hypothetical protein